MGHLANYILPQEIMGMGILTGKKYIMKVWGIFN